MHSFDEFRSGSVTRSTGGVDSATDAGRHHPELMSRVSQGAVHLAEQPLGLDQRRDFRSKNIVTLAHFGQRPPRIIERPQGIVEREFDLRANHFRTCEISLKGGDPLFEFLDQARMLRGRTGRMSG